MVINLVRENPIQILSNDFQVFYPNFLTFDHDFSITFSFLIIDIFQASRKNMDTRKCNKCLESYQNQAC